MAAKEEKGKPTAEEQHEKHNQKAKENAAESRTESKGKKDAAVKHTEDPDQQTKRNKAKDTAAESRAETKGNSKSNAAGKAGSEDEIDEAQELDGLLKIFDGHEIAEIDLDTATGMIDEWYDILHKSKDESYKEVAANLKQLKKLLSGKKDQSEEVAELLDELGGQTDELADNAQRGYKGKLHNLAKALHHASTSVEDAIDIDDEDLDENLDEDEDL